MCGGDEFVPRKGKGRPFRPMGLDALKPIKGARVDTPRCNKCEKWLRDRMWCPVKAAMNNGRGPMCKYGIVLLRAARLRRKRDELGKEDAQRSNQA